MVGLQRESGRESPIELDSARVRARLSTTSRVSLLLQQKAPPSII